MILQKRFNRIVNGKQYDKWVVEFPPSMIEQLGWKAKQKLEAKIVNGKIQVSAIEK